MNKLQKTLDAVMSAYEASDSELVEAFENTDTIISHAESIQVTLCQEEAELISKTGLEWIDNFINGEDEWDFYRDKAFKQLDIE